MEAWGEAFKPKAWVQVLKYQIYDLVSSIKKLAQTSPVSPFVASKKKRSRSSVNTLLGLGFEGHVARGSPLTFDKLMIKTFLAKNWWRRRESNKHIHL